MSWIDLRIGSIVGALLDAERERAIVSAGMAGIALIWSARRAPRKRPDSEAFRRAGPSRRDGWHGRYLLVQRDRRRSDGDRSDRVAREQGRYPDAHAQADPAHDSRCQLHARSPPVSCRCPDHDSAVHGATALVWRGFKPGAMSRAVPIRRVGPRPATGFGARHPFKLSRSPCYR